MRAADHGWERLEEAVPRELLRTEVEAWARRIGVQPRELHIRPMTRKWGSCSTSGRVSFNTDLLRQPADFRRRVIVEELLHLKVPNHGRLFRSLLHAYLGAAEGSRMPRLPGDSPSRAHSRRSAGPNG
jgi:predicted metal-dependent hydrolase